MTTKQKAEELKVLNPMAEYRKNRNREFFKIDGRKLTRVFSMQNSARLELMDSPMMVEAVLHDNLYTECTEQEFNEAFKEARDRILLDRL